MDDRVITQVPPALDAIRSDTHQLGFAMASDPQTGSLLRALAASKPGGRLLELGTGTGIGTAWLLAGMDADSQLDSVESDPRVLAIAQRHLGQDPRVRFHLADGVEFLVNAPRCQFDFIFADTWPGKFVQLDQALSLVRPGGLYVVDDLLPQPNWPAGHAPKVPALIAELESRRDFVAVKLAWATGLMLLVRTQLPDQGKSSTDDV
jgi:predicted O-methyltransferase YrrM